MLLMQVIKMALACRFYCSLENGDPQMIRKNNRDLKRLTAEMNRSPIIGISTKVIHTLMAAFPELYRRFRLIDLVVSNKL